MDTFTKSLSYIVFSTLIIGIIAIQSFDLFGNEKNNDQLNAALPVANDETGCAHDHLLKKELETDPALKAKLQVAETQYQNFVQNPTESLADFTLPVVFHIVHDDGDENIDDTQVEQAVSFLNEAYANTGYYDQNTGVNTEIEFCLAKTGPDGNPHPGITRTKSDFTELNMETDDLALKNLIRWDPTQYINIWVVRSVGGTGINTQVTGYAYLPAFHGSDKDGIVIEAMFAGSDEMMTSILAHQMGHYLGLYHTYEGGCLNDDCSANGDKVCDTPPDWTVALPPCDVTVNSCYTDVNPSDPNNPFTEDQLDMRENYMDWSPFECYSAFTQGQADRMAIFINGDRASLLSSTVCINDCDDPITELNLMQGDTMIPFGTQLPFTVEAMDATTFEWFLNGVSQGTGPTIVINFPDVDTYTVTVTASNDDAACNISASATILSVDCYGSAHVDDAAGVDVEMCGGIGNPCKTIQYALDNIVCSGDTVYIHSGTYSLGAGVDALIPVANIPEDYTVTFFGVENNGPVNIDGGGIRRGFKYRYSNSGNPNPICPDIQVGNMEDVTHQINFTNLTIQNCKITAPECTDGVFRGNGGGIYIVGNDGSDLTMTVDNCKFFNNLAEDLTNLNNDGNSASGGAIFFGGQVDADAPAGTGSRIFISDSEFSSNRAEKNDNGGQGGAVAIHNSDTTHISGSYFCNNTVFGANADDGDTGFNRNAGGAIAISDNFNLANPMNHNYIIDNCTFLGNTALTPNGATFPDQSEGGAIFISTGTNSTLVPNTTANLIIGNSSFFDNNIETGQQDFSTADGAGIDIATVGNNVFQDDPYMFSLGNDETICNNDSITIGVTTLLPNAFYEWNTGQNTPTVTISDTGLYILTITLGACSVSDSIVITEIICGEVCGNGIDDDGNGLIDCYDPACCADGLCNDQYYNACPDPCTFTVNDNTFEAKRKWQSDEDFSLISTPITGDIDGDGIPEILVHQGEVAGNDKFSIISGATGMEELELTISQSSVTPSISAIADVDNDGTAEIFIYGDANSTLHRFEHDGSLTVSKEITGAGNFVKAINVADFDGDGQDEIYVSNLILDATTLDTEVSLPSSVFNTNVGVAADVLPDADCTTCEGMELVMGNTVYAINLTAGIATPVVTSTMADGIASLADIDGDGDVDAVVSAFNNNDPNSTIPLVYAWDLQTTTTTTLGQITPAENASPTTLADIDGDGSLEIVYKTSTQLIALENDFSSKWIVPISIAGLNMNASVAFDFDGDGDYEIVDQDGMNLRVIDGTNGNVLFTDDQVLTVSGFQNPVVADVDGDGLTEILIAAATSTLSVTQNRARLILFESDSYPWQTTRSVWNQFNWFHVQVQDDLALPMIQQQHHLIPALNNFRTQHGEQIGSDATITLVDAQCDLDFIDVTVEICNTGVNNLSGTTPIAFYTDDPTAGSASLLATEFLASVLPPDSCMVRMLRIPSQYVDPVFIVVNDDGSESAPYNFTTDFPVTNIGECNYANNMTSFLIEPEPFRLDLGEDLFVCDNAAVVLDASSDFVSYEWQDGSTEQTFTTEDGGEYYVIVVDSCGGIQSDTINITVDPNTVNMTMPEVAEVCPGQTATFMVEGMFDTYQWRGDMVDLLDCDTCQTVNAINVTEPTQFFVTASDSNTGCYSVDTVQVVLMTIETEDQVQACAGEAVVIHGEMVTAPGSYPMMFTSIEGCDSTSTVTFSNYPPLGLDFTVVPTCPQGSIGTATVFVQGGVATDYMWSTGVTGTPTIEDLAAGTYTVTVTDGNLCTTVGSVTVTEEETNIETQSIEPTCPGGDDGQLTILNGQAGWTYSIDGTTFQASPVFDGLAAGTYTVFIQAGDCLYTGAGVVEGAPEIFVSIPPITLNFPEEATVMPSIGSDFPIATYSWSPSNGLSCDDCLNPVVSGSQSGTYTLTVTDENGCTGQGTFELTVQIACDPTSVKIPNVFTPDRDEMNDDFGAVIQAGGFEEIKEMRIYNRWGNLVYESSGETDPRWDGMQNDKAAPSDVYVYFVRVGCSIDPTVPEEVLSGDVTLIR